MTVPMIKAPPSLPADGVTPRMILWRRWAIPFSLALLGFVLHTIVATSMAGTEDEGWHWRYGLAILEGSPDRSIPDFDSKMPVSALNALPREVSKVIYAKRVTNRLALAVAQRLGDFRATRYATILAAFALSLLVYLYAESLFGRAAGLFAQLLFVISPNIIAHATLTTTDLYIALATIAFLYSFRRFLLRPGFGNAALTASALALSQLTKFTAAYLNIALLLLLASALLYAKYGKSKHPGITLRHVALLLGLYIVCFLAFINAGFLCDRTFTPLARYKFHSTTFKALQQVPILRAIPLPVPYPYLQGFDWMSYHNTTGQSFGNIVLLGEVRGPELPRFDGFPSYYLVAYVLKEPLGLQLLLLLSILWTIRHRRLADFFTGEWPLIVTAAVFLFVLSFFSKTQIGIRHILPVLVIFVILSGGAFAAGLHSSRRRLFLLGGCLLWIVISVGSYFPHMIPYFNEIVMDKKMAYRYLADSNLDWGQDRWVVQDFLKRNPDVILNPPQPVTGRILVSADLMAGVRPKKADYWLRQNGPEPVAHVAYARLLFVVPAAK